MLKLGGDWVPTWSGDLDDWEMYKIRAGIYVRGADQWKQGQRISNLVQVLEGKAWEAIENLSDNERDKIQESLVPFLAFLKEQCLPTAIPELGRRFREYFRFRRIRKESMRIYVKRYRLQLVKLENSMRAVDDGTSMLKKLQKAVREHFKVLSAKRLLEETRRHKAQIPLTPKAKARNWKSAGQQPGTSSSAPQTWDWEDWEEEGMENEEEESDFEDDKSVNPSELSGDKRSNRSTKTEDPKLQNYTWSGWGSGWDEGWQQKDWKKPGSTHSRRSKAPRTFQGACPYPGHHERPIRRSCNFRQSRETNFSALERGLPTASPYWLASSQRSWPERY